MDASNNCTSTSSSCAGEDDTVSNIHYNTYPQLCGHMHSSVAAGKSLVTIVARITLAIGMTTQ